jgi:hypothetical protein
LGRDIALSKSKYSIQGMFPRPEEPDMRALSLRQSRLEALQRRVDRWHLLGAYGAISFLTLVVLLTLP